MNDDKPYLGHAVENGRIRFGSVSQIVIADHEQEGGCRRRWAFRYVFGKKEVKTAAQLAGNKFASSLETYLKTGYDAMEPELRVAKHLFPKYDPARPLTVEEPLGDIAAAVKLREQLLANPLDADSLRPAIRRLAGLVANYVPLTGAADYAHRRQEYVDGDGVLRREDPGMVVCEVVDLKSTSKIDTTVSWAGVTYEGRAKTVEQILAHPQTLGYGVWAADKYPDLTHNRLGHVYIQTRGAKIASKRTGLLTVEEVRRRWTKYDALMAEMEDIAQASRPEDVPFNINSCFAFHRECDHAPYCDRSGARRSIFDILGLKKENTVDLFNQLAAPPIPSTAPPVLSPEQREAAIAAETARLLAEDAAPPQPRTGCGAPGCGEGCAPGYVRTSGIASFAECTACKGTGRRPIGAILPPDAPVPSELASAAAVSPEARAEITDPALQIKVEAHARAHAAKAQATVEGTSATWCIASGRRIVLDPNITVKSYLCPECGKKNSIKPSADKKEATLPRHKPLKVEGAQAKTAALSIPSGPPPIPQGGPPPIPSLGSFLVEKLPVAYGTCVNCSVALSAENASKLPSGEVRHIGCAPRSRLELTAAEVEILSGLFRDRALAMRSALSAESVALLERLRLL